MERRIYELTIPADSKYYLQLLGMENECIGLAGSIYSQSFARLDIKDELFNIYGNKGFDPANIMYSKLLQKYLIMSEDRKSIYSFQQNGKLVLEHKTKSPIETKIYFTPFVEGKDHIVMNLFSSLLIFRNVTTEGFDNYVEIFRGCTGFNREKFQNIEFLTDTEFLVIDSHSGIYVYDIEGTMKTSLIQGEHTINQSLKECLIQGSNVSNKEQKGDFFDLYGMTVKRMPSQASELRFLACSFCRLWNFDFVAFNIVRDASHHWMINQSFSLVDNNKSIDYIRITKTFLVENYSPNTDLLVIIFHPPGDIEVREIAKDGSKISVPNLSPFQNDPILNNLHFDGDRSFTSISKLKKIFRLTVQRSK